jgi:hypothetical protein
VTVLEPDEMTCPFCGARIKAAAVKCPSCHSDLPASDPHDLGLAGRVAGYGPWSEPVPGPVSGQSSDRSRDQGVLVLGALCAVLSATLVSLILVEQPDSLETASNGQVTSAHYRADAMNTAAADARLILSYSYRSFDADTEAARAAMAPLFAVKYDATLPQLRSATTRSRLTQTGTVVSTSLVSLTRSRASLMLLTNLVTVPEGSKAGPRQRVNRVEMTMERNDGRWIVSNLMPF